MKEEYVNLSGVILLFFIMHCWVSDPSFPY